MNFYTKWQIFRGIHCPFPWLNWFILFLSPCLIFLKYYYHSFFIFTEYKTRDCIPQLVTDYLQKKINIDPIITHQLPFDKLHEALELFHAGKTWVLHLPICTPIPHRRKLSSVTSQRFYENEMVAWTFAFTLTLTLFLPSWW